MANASLTAVTNAKNDEFYTQYHNPPFSLFREFLRWIVAADKKCLMIGSANAITCNASYR